MQRDKQGQDKHGLLTAPIDKVLRQMTLPMVLGIVAILMFNLVDTFFISLLGTQALAAISFTFPVTFAMNCITMGIGMGLSTFVGRLLGQKQPEQAARFSSHGILLALVLVCITSFIGLQTIDPLFTLLGAKAELLPLIDQYMYIWYLTIPLLVIPMSGNAAIRACGDTKTPAKIMIIAGVINGILDPLLIFGIGPFPELGIQGAAIASGISWFGAMLCAFYILVVKVKLLAKPIPKQLLSDWKSILQIGTPAALSNALNPLSAAIFMTILAKHGTEAVAAYGAAQRIESLMLIVLMALTSVLTPFMSQNLGANNPQRSFKALFMCMRFSLFFQLLLFIMMVPLSSHLANLFSQEQSVNHLLWLYLVCVPVGYGFQGIIMLLVSSLNAMHKPISAFTWSCLRLFVFTLPCAWLGSQWFGITGLFIGIALGNVIGGVAGYLYASMLCRKILNEKSPA
ncbi:MATE family efflux transporter [Vibrio sp. UCD-FRSSP16_10]|uniref:MATE family efflux transporter n=1 Tax=unclassified Vibrio TaxID=2614977 RepID=UPI0007FCA09D|nr:MULTISPECIES: MATE family efflux transporter [unclassified Vibrio]OBT16415.1 MATE family efflux transporter [Vibrio sp. UCD-FRSSP16_30]OBT21280.1 MATE family efflux transporter [Vibrio sp. UCD-FRSSP16_10]